MERPRKEKEAFKDINTIEEFLTSIESNDLNLKYLYDNYFNNDTLETALTSINNLKGSKEKEFIHYLHFVDKKLNFPVQAKQNRRHKIPTIFAGAIYLDKLYKEFKIYTDVQRIIIAKYSITEELDFYKNINNYFSRNLILR